MIIPAQVPNIGIPSSTRLRSGSSRSKIRASLDIVVDSPPGMTSPSQASSSAGRRTADGRSPAPRARRGARARRPGGRARRWSDGAGLWAPVESRSAPNPRCIRNETVLMAILAWAAHTPDRRRTLMVDYRIELIIVPVERRRPRPRVLRRHPRAGRSTTTRPSTRTSASSRSRRPESACSIAFGRGLSEMEPGSLQGRPGGGRLGRRGAGRPAGARRRGLGRRRPAVGPLRRTSPTPTATAGRCRSCPTGARPSDGQLNARTVPVGCLPRGGTPPGLVG